MPRKKKLEPPPVTLAQRITLIVTFAWVAWAIGAAWSFWHDDFSTTTGAQVMATLLVAIVFSTFFLREIGGVSETGARTQNAGALLLGFIAIGILSGLDPTLDDPQRAVVAGGTFASVMLAIGVAATAVSRTDGL